DVTIPILWIPIGIGIDGIGIDGIGIDQYRY
ncbi:unnamed protein product, partial [Rotaria sordida]